MALTEVGAGQVEWTPEDDFGVRLGILRVWLGRMNQTRTWNVSKAAAFCGIDAGSWANWEMGKGCTDHENVCRKIALHTGCNLDWLFRGGPLPYPFVRWNTDGPLLTSVKSPAYEQIQLAVDVPAAKLSLVPPLVPS